MTNDKVYGMAFSKVYPLLIAKAVRKGRSADEVHTVTAWLTGYTSEQLTSFLETDLTYGDFFRNAPCMNENRHAVTGSICGVRISDIEDPLMRDIRILDKLVDELAKGKTMDKILRK